MLCVVCMIQQAQPVACSDTLNTHSLHLHLQLTSMQYMVESVSQSAWKSFDSHHNHTPSNTQLYKHTQVCPVMFENSHFKLSSCLLLYLWYLNCPHCSFPPDPPPPPLLSYPLSLYTLPRLVGMVMLMGWPLLGAEKSSQKEHHHGEEKAISRWAASANALLQFGNLGVKFTWKIIETEQKRQKQWGKVMRSYYSIFFYT